MMLMQLLRQGKLNPKRGDVIVFNNTSAEHSATYEFTRKFKKLAEEKYGIPFFWIEFQTYEAAGNHGCWIRKPTYRLVNERPFSDDNPQGYRYKGEVFEEMISLNGFLPSVFDRTCTLNMKIFVTNAFLSDWLAQKDGIDWQGHYYDTAQMSNDDIIATHDQNRGGTPHKILLEKKAFLKQCSFHRPEQKWQDFTHAAYRFNNKALKESVIGKKAPLYGDDAVEYVSYLGIRHDEQSRIGKIKTRIDAAQNNGGKSFFNQPWEEKVVAPLIDGNVSQEGVIHYWKKQAFNLELPETGIYSNCVYCPLKGKGKLLQIAYAESQSSVAANTDTPESIKWWQMIEEKYSRDLVKEGRTVTSDNKFVSFWGATKKIVFKVLEEKAQSSDDPKLEAGLMDINLIPCNCTD